MTPRKRKSHGGIRAGKKGKEAVQNSQKASVKQLDARRDTKQPRSHKPSVEGRDLWDDVAEHIFDSALKSRYGRVARPDLIHGLRKRFGNPTLFGHEPNGTPTHQEEALREAGYKKSAAALQLTIDAARTRSSEEERAKPITAVDSRQGNRWDCEAGGSSPSGCATVSNEAINAALTALSPTYASHATLRIALEAAAPLLLAEAWRAYGMICGANKTQAGMIAKLEAELTLAKAPPTEAEIEAGAKRFAALEYVDEWEGLPPYYQKHALAISRAILTAK